MKIKTTIGIILSVAIGFCIGFFFPKEIPQEKKDAMKKEFDVIYTIVENYISSTDELMLLYNSSNDSIEFKENYTKIIDSSNDTKYFIAKSIDNFENNYTRSSSYMQNLKQLFFRQTEKVDRHIKNLGE
jgi:nicotinamide riboside kinase